MELLRIALALHKILQHFERVVEVVFVFAPIAFFHYVERHHFGQDDLEQTAAIQVNESARRVGRQHDFVELIDDSLSGNDLDAFFVAFERLEGLFLNLEIKLSGKSHAAHHTEWVVAERDVGIQRRGHDAIFQIVDSAEWINEFAEPVRVETDRQRIDGKVAAALVVLQCTVFDNRFARIVRVTLLSRSHEFNFLFVPFGLAVFAHHFVTPFHLRSPKVAEHAAMGSLAQGLGIGFSGLDARTDHHHINVFRRAFEDVVAHVAADDIALEP